MGRGGKKKAKKGEPEAESSETSTSTEIQGTSQKQEKSTQPLSEEVQQSRKQESKEPEIQPSQTSTSSEMQQRDTQKPQEKQTQPLTGAPKQGRKKGKKEPAAQPSKASSPIEVQQEVSQTQEIYTQPPRESVKQSLKANQQKTKAQLSQATTPGGLQQGDSKEQKGKRSQPPTERAKQTSQRDTASSVSQITKQIAAIAISSGPVRTGGTKGRKIRIESNHFRLDISKLAPFAYHYDITFDPDRPKRNLRTVWENFRRKYLPSFYPAFDDVKNLFSIKQLPENMLVGEVVITSDEYSKPKEYKVAIKFANRINLAALEEYINNTDRNKPVVIPQDAIQCVDVVLRNAPAIQFTRVGRSYFTQPRSIIDLGDGMELWTGFYQSAILGWRPYLNVDVVHKGFPKEMNVIDFIAEVNNMRVENLNRELEYYTIQKLSKELKGLKVLYQLPNEPSSKRRLSRVNGLVENPCKAVFQLESGKTSSVYEYYKSEKKITLKYPYMPCVWVGSRQSKIYYPAEFCTIQKGQVVNKQMTENQTRQMIRNAATSTDIRKDKIMHNFNKANINNDLCIKQFGISVGTSFEKITARVLDPPKLQYGQGECTPSRGVWQSSTFLNPQKVTNWTVLVLSNTRESEVDKFVGMLMRGGQQSNMSFDNVTKPYTFMRTDTRRLLQFFEKNQKMQLIFVIVPEGNSYATVKQIAELQVGCLTQCIKERTMFRSLNPATVGNILLKINAKLNGRNHQLASVSRPRCLLTPCMIMGADVTHPTPDQLGRPSVAAVAASHDPAAFQYNFCWRLQPARQEIITDLEEIVEEQLGFFKNQTGHAPQTIIFYRDGVSEGQFAQVRDAEIKAIERACARKNPNYKPPITFLVVQKRHHTRFFPTDKRDSQDRNLNVPAGTCVDTDIVHRRDIEYYLVSHASIQGVARPTKYRVLRDDFCMTEDEIQQLTYFLCHMFTRCNRSVSYPAPTYYAHLAAFRANVYLKSVINMDNLKKEQLDHQIKEQICKLKPMFFV